MKLKHSGDGKRKRPSVKKVNPFELKFNRNKHKVLGTGRNAASGAPTLSKKKAFENRLGSLAVEMKQFGKTNKIVDRRLGERDTRITEEERVVKRFTAERLNTFKGNKFQLLDPQEDELTHKGSSLTSIEKYERTQSDDESDEGGEVGAAMVRTAHFGGGVQEDSEDKPTPRVAKRKELIEELIAKTKQQRYDKQMAKDEQDDATDQLDEQWKRLMQTGTMAGFANAPARDTARENDGYDQLFTELKLDNSKRGEATDRQRTVEEVARDERLRLVELEKARIARMEGNPSAKRSGPESGDVEDISAVSKNKRPSGFEVKYDLEGKLINTEKVKRARIKIVRIDNESSDSEGDTSMSDDMESDEEDLDTMLKEECPDLEIESVTQETVPERAVTTPSKAKSEESTSALPYTFEMPSRYEDLSRLLQPHSAVEIQTIIERLMKCYHPSLKEGNKKRLARLFLYLLRFYDSLSEEGAKRLDVLGVIIKCLHSLMKYDVEYSARCVRALLRQQWKAHERTRHTVFGFRAVSLLRLVAALFPVTDLFHPICTPTMAFAVALVGSVRVTCIKSVARVLLLLKVLLEYVRESKRYVPELIAFLQGVLLMGVENGEHERCPTATFPISLPFRRMLFVDNDCSDLDSPLMLNLSEVFDDAPSSFDSSDENRLSVMRFALALLGELASMYSVHRYCFQAIFNPLKALLSRLPQERYSLSLRNQLTEILASISAECDKNSALTQLQKPKQVKKSLEMLEPRFETNFNAERSRRDTVKGGRKADNKALARKMKKETRGAVRELRKDNQFIAREERRETTASDKARIKKTKDLMHSLQGQESEYKKNFYMNQAPRR